MCGWVFDDDELTKQWSGFNVLLVGIYIQVWRINWLWESRNVRKCQNRIGV